MTVEWNRTVTEVVWESQTAPGITWTTVVGGTSSGGGVTVHNDLSGRSAADAHPMSAITDLEPALTDIATAVQAQQGDIGTLQTAVAGKQAADADLTAIAALAPADDALIQRKAGAWTSRTPAQVKADMSIGVGDVSGLDENTRDVIGAALVAGSGVAVTVDDPGNTITIAVSGVVADAINDGTTTVAPSQNAVFDALALKITNPGGANDDFLQRKAGAWTYRTPAQVKTDLGITTPVAAVPVTLSGVQNYALPGVSWGTTAGTRGINSNQIWYLPFFVTAPIVVDRIVLYDVTTAQTGANAHIGIYAADASWQPTGAPLADQTVSTATTGTKSATVSVALAPGRYLAALLNDTGGVVVRAGSLMPLWHQDIGASAAGSASIMPGEYRQSQTYGALPTTGPAYTVPIAYSTGPATGWPLVLLRWS